MTQHFGIPSVVINASGAPLREALAEAEVWRNEDARRLDWLEAEPERLREVYWRMENEGEDLRTAIDVLTARQAQ